jgi:hypothetical protein
LQSCNTLFLSNINSIFYFTKTEVFFEIQTTDDFYVNHTEQS